MQFLAVQDILDGKLFDTSSRAVIGPAQQSLASHLFKPITLSA